MYAVYYWYECDEQVDSGAIATFDKKVDAEIFSDLLAIKDKDEPVEYSVDEYEPLPHNESFHEWSVRMEAEKKEAKREFNRDWPGNEELFDALF